MEIITGYLHSVVFSNPQTHYHVIRIRIDQKKDEKVIVVGYYEIPGKQELCRFHGEYKDHPKYGRQLVLSHLEKVMPTDPEAVVRFLSSALFPKVGKKTAQKIVTTLGEQCIQQIMDRPEILIELGLKEEIRLSITKGLNQSTRLEEALKLFVGHGIGMKELIKMDAVYGNQMIDIVRRNPYQLVRDIDGMGFRTVDRIALSMGVEARDERRVEAAMVHAATTLCYKQQNTYTDFGSLIKEVTSMIEGLDEQIIVDAFHSLVERKELIQENHRIFPFSLYEAELGIAHYIAPYIAPYPVSFDSVWLLSQIDQLQTRLGIQYSEEQQAAIVQALTFGISIITGGPGTGKTTVVRAIIDLYHQIYPSHSVTLCAPTGRASKRLSELTGEEATTIHRFLAWDLDTNRFGVDHINPKEGHFLIVDEFSMVDAVLFFHLLQGTHPYHQIVLIGDDQQLPPVSPGDVLSDLLAINEIPTTKLIKIHRQKDDSGIIPLAANIRQGYLDRQNLQKSDTQFLAVSSSNVPMTIINLCQDLIEEGYQKEDIQVLAPMYDGNSGITHLNDLLRDFFNPPTPGKKESQIGRTTYREGDKILQLKNQPNDDVYNGDIGILVSIEGEEKAHPKFVVDFDGNEVTYSDFTNISLAYCVSVHKSQGSEYPIVIMPMVSEHRIMLRKKLIYTGITRPKKKLFLIGDIRAFETGIVTLERNKRLTTLVEKIQAKF